MRPTGDAVSARGGGQRSHARDEQRPPWRRRPRRAVDLRNGIHLHAVLLLGSVTVGSTWGGLNALTGRTPASHPVLGGLAVLLGMLIAAAGYAYLRRPVGSDERRPRP